MENPVTPQKKPYKVIVEKGKTYSWCACGLSLKQPFCDGTHKKEGKFKSLKYLAAENKEIYFFVVVNFHKMHRFVMVLILNFSIS